MPPAQFSVEESTALLHAIFPNYPALSDPRPTPDLAEFLERYRAEAFDTGTVGHEEVGL